MMRLTLVYAAILAGIGLLFPIPAWAQPAIEYGSRTTVSPASDLVSRVNDLFVGDIDFNGFPDVVAAGPSLLSAYLNEMAGRSFTDFGDYGDLLRGSESISGGFISPSTGALIVALSRDNMPLLGFIPAAILQGEALPVSGT